MTPPKKRRNLYTSSSKYRNWPRLGLWAVGLCSLGLAGLGVSLGWVCEPMNVQRWVLSYNEQLTTTEVNQKDSEQNEVDGMKKGADSTGKVMHV